MFHRVMNYGELDIKPTVVLTKDTIKRILPKYKRHGDLLLIQEQTWDEFKKSLPMPVVQSDNSPFSIDEDELASLVCQAVQKPVCRRLAIERRVKDDGFRHPNVQILLGNNGIVQHKDNHIIYEFDVTKCMFSFGNVSEKLRVASLDCSEEIVVDLFAGIGYFTLPLLVHCNAKHVYACDWNPDAVESLKRNLILNKIDPSRCTIIEGDNRTNNLSNVAQRVLLGILPSCQDFMGKALECVNKSTGAIMHCHDLVEAKPTSDNIDNDSLHEYKDSPARQSTVPSDSCSFKSIDHISVTGTNSHIDGQPAMNLSLTPSRASSHSTIEKLSMPLENIRLQGCENESKESSPNNTSELTTEHKNDLSNTSNGSFLEDCKLLQGGGDLPSSSSDENGEAHDGSVIDVNSIGSDPNLENLISDNKSIFELRAHVLIARIENELVMHNLEAKLLHTQLVKSYAPHVYHVVFDIKVSPKNNN